MVEEIAMWKIVLYRDGEIVHRIFQSKVNITATPDGNGHEVTWDGGEGKFDGIRFIKMTDNTHEEGECL